MTKALSSTHNNILLEYGANLLHVQSLIIDRTMSQTKMMDSLASLYQHIRRRTVDYTKHSWIVKSLSRQDKDVLFLLELLGEFHVVVEHGSKLVKVNLYDGIHGTLGCVDCQSVTFGELLANDQGPRFKSLPQIQPPLRQNRTGSQERRNH